MIPAMRSETLLLEPAMGQQTSPPVLGVLRWFQARQTMQQGGRRLSFQPISCTALHSMCIRELQSSLVTSSHWSNNSGPHTPHHIMTRQITSLVQEIHFGWPTGKSKSIAIVGFLYGFSMGFIRNRLQRSRLGPLTCFTFHSLLRPVYLSIPWQPQHAGRIWQISQVITERRWSFGPLVLPHQQPGSSTVVPACSSMFQQPHWIALKLRRHLRTIAVAIGVLLPHWALARTLPSHAGLHLCWGSWPKPLGDAWGWWLSKGSKGTMLKIGILRFFHWAESTFHWPMFSPTSPRPAHWVEINRPYWNGSKHKNFT